MRKTLFAIMLALALVLIPVGSAFAATTQDVTVNATPSILSISNAPADWTIDSPDKILHNSTYYSNDADNTIAPSDPPLQAECRFTVTNDGDITADIAISFSDFLGGAAWANSDTGNATTTDFGARGYVEGVALPGVALTVAGTADVIADLLTTADISWGLIVATPTDVQTVGGAMAATVTLTAEEG